MYIKDVNSLAALAFLRQNKSVLFLSNLTELEFFNAAERRFGRNQLSRAELEEAYASFEGDVANGVLQVLDIEPATWAKTKELILRYTAPLGCRTADIIHVAAAIVIRADRMLTFDIRQKELVRLLKLRTN